jgi:hypothetical protein
MDIFVDLARFARSGRIVEYAYFGCFGCFGLVRAVPSWERWIEGGAYWAYMTSTRGAYALYALNPLYAGGCAYERQDIDAPRRGPKNGLFEVYLGGESEIGPVGESEIECVRKAISQNGPYLLAIMTFAY